MLKSISQISLINYSLHDFITKCDNLFQIVIKVYYKIYQVFIINCDRSITKCKMRQTFQRSDSYYKIRHILQNVPV